MTDAARTILDQALSLADEERLHLAEALFDSLPADAQEQIDRAWREEVLHRMGQVRPMMLQGRSRYTVLKFGERQIRALTIP